MLWGVKLMHWENLDTFVGMKTKSSEQHIQIVVCKCWICPYWQLKKEKLVKATQGVVSLTSISSRSQSDLMSQGKAPVSQIHLAERPPLCCCSYTQTGICKNRTVTSKKMYQFSQDKKLSTDNHSCLLLYWQMGMPCQASCACKGSWKFWSGACKYVLKSKAYLRDSASIRLFLKAPFRRASLSASKARILSSSAACQTFDIKTEQSKTLSATC